LRSGGAPARDPYVSVEADSIDSVPVARVIIADDHEVIRAGMRRLLDRERAIEVVGEAANGSDALDLVRQHRPDLVLLDVRMPDMDGLAVTQAIKNDSPATSVILFTMYQDADYLLGALRAGASAFLLKGATRDQILTTVRQVLAGESVLHPELVLELLRQFSNEARAGDQGQLTQREHDVLRLIVRGHTNREIANNLRLTLSTVKTHVEHVLGKLGVSDRTQAAVRAIELGLVTGERS
jgi:DNA-binding NarL/FixJ family response regulator